MRQPELANSLQDDFRRAHSTTMRRYEKAVETGGLSTNTLVRDLNRSFVDYTFDLIPVKTGEKLSSIMITCTRSETGETENISLHFHTEAENIDKGHCGIGLSVIDTIGEKSFSGIYNPNDTDQREKLRKGIVELLACKFAARDIQARCPQIIESQLNSATP